MVKIRPAENSVNGARVTAPTRLGYCVTVHRIDAAFIMTQNAKIQIVIIKSFLFFVEL